MTHSVLFEVRSAQARVARARGNMPYGSEAMHTLHSLQMLCPTHTKIYKDMIKQTTSATLSK